MMKIRRSFAALLSAATLMAGPEVATAQPAAVPSADAASDDASKRANELVEKAKSLYLRGKYQEAEALLLTAWELNPTFDVAYNLGNAEYKLKKYREAAHYLSFALRNWPLLKQVVKLKPKAQEWFNESRTHVGTLSVTVSVGGAEVVVDGKVVDRSPMEGAVFVEPGEHLVEARLEGHVTASQTVKVAKGELITMRLKLEPVRPAAPAGAGASGAPLAGSSPGPDAPRGPAPVVEQRSWVPVIALGAASVVGLGVGVGLTVASNNASADVDAQGKAILEAGGRCNIPTSAFTGRCAELQDAGSRQETLGNAAGVVFAASGALAIAAATYALWPRAERRVAAPVRVLPAVSEHDAGVTLFSVW